MRRSRSLARETRYTAGSITMADTGAGCLTAIGVRVCQCCGSKSARSRKAAAKRLRASFIVFPPAFDKASKTGIEEGRGDQQNPEGEESRDAIDALQLPDIK